MARDASLPPSPSRAPAGRYRPWLGPLLVGLAFGVGYGLTDRLLRLNPGGWVPLGQTFDHRPAPGTSLESLRQRSGDLSSSVRGDLEAEAEQALFERQAALERERLKQQEAVSDPALIDPEASQTPSPEEPVAEPMPPASPPAAAPRPGRPVTPAPLPTP